MKARKIAKQGRKRKQNVERLPSGKIDHKAEQVKGFEERVKERARVYNLTPAQAIDPAAGTFIGRMMLAKELTEEHYKAGLHWAEQRTIFYMAKGFPPVCAPSTMIALEGRGKSCRDEPPEDKIVEIMRRHSDMYRAVSPDQVALLDHTCLRDEAIPLSQVRALAFALKAIANHVRGDVRRS